MGLKITENHVEEAALEWLRELGWETLHGAAISPEGARPERASYADVVLQGRLTRALHFINPTLPGNFFEDVTRKIFQSETPSLIEENRRLHRLIVDGVDVEVMRDDGSISGEKVWLIDFEHPERNEFLAVNQFTVIEDGFDRRPDIVLFINGLPVAVIELKNAADAEATNDRAFQQTQTYKSQIPSLFRTNGLIAVSDGIEARYGSLTADKDRFMPWRTADGATIAKKGTPELETLIKGLFSKENLPELIRGYTVFEDDGTRLIKKIAGYHQFFAVKKAVESTVSASKAGGDRKAGVIWHTQGSGKSLLMTFYGGRIIQHPAMQNPTLVIITDRNDLDDQLFGTFSNCKDLLRQTPRQAESREQLQELLSVNSGGIIFATIQKFFPAKDEENVPLLTDRRNVIVIADEAHRTQYGFKAKVNQKTGEKTYGFAKYLRDALPNASYIGFTGTPIEGTDVNTPAVFGEYIDVYDIHRAVEDKATVPIYYESRLARLDLDEDEKPKIDAEIEELTEDQEQDLTEKAKSKWSRVEALAGAEKRLKIIAKDMVDHLEARLAGYPGKAMFVCMSRRICVALYKEIITLRPEWHSEDDRKGVVKVVMTGSASDPEDWQQHIGKGSGKSRRDALAKRAKDPADELKLVLVRDMWLTGFDAPCMHTMYIDKPMKGHGLMQAIARVNRVFKDKPGGLIVDYIGVAHSLKSALLNYSDSDRGETGISEEEAVEALQKCYEVVVDMYHGFDYALGVSGTPQQRLQVMAGAMDWILTLLHKEAQEAKTDERKKQIRRRYDDAVLALGKAFALGAASDYAREIRDEVGFFQAVRSALSKSTADGTRKSSAEIEAGIQQIVSRAVVSTEIIDILSAAGIKTPDISILSDDFLAELQGMDKKNLALEALRKLLNGEIKSTGKTNVVQARAFSERLEDAITRYHNNALTTAQVLEELIKIAKDIRTARARGEEEGLSAEEVAFYDALAENDTAVDIMGDDKLRLIAHDLMQSIRENISVDWQRRDSARAKIRVLVKRILKKYGYPPDLQDEAVRTVIEQAERWSAEWAKGQ
ncbi:MAG TPA: type I restriction endonuclease subunit R [Alphaproteobacteria bacterium]|nr:type I restriction endonuclease subunit R [Alphaproteobacteria bacterium]